jgi:hypothetical protein
LSDDELMAKGKEIVMKSMSHVGNEQLKGEVWKLFEVWDY